MVKTFNEAFLQLKTPAYIADEAALIRNLEILRDVKDRAGCKILLAQKAFSMFALYPVIDKYLDGSTASGLYEARLGREEFKGEVHVFSPAFTDEEMDELVKISDHIVFNSVAQLKIHTDKCRKNGVSVGLRINPECSTQEHGIYDPCAPLSRLGVTLANFDESVLDLIDGLHFHTLCEQNADDLETTLKAVEEKFGKYISRMKWVNFGGGHHITRSDYDRELLIDLVNNFRAKYGVEVYLEPGEAIALNAGYLATKVMDIVDNGGKIAILDTSAACHMPDVLEMPYRPPLFASALPGEKKYTYRLSSRTCLAGDVIGDYSFDTELEVGDILVFDDMAIYSMVKNNTFNGMPLPDIDLLTKEGEVKVVKAFDYSDFKGRLS
ncbi:MAG: carboxynorspermidine decarboxylase [Lachnospiraceae bacterium]|nr:carboxynorspermidine decarboxylase [Lachnospiraceae bacterium]